MGFWLQYMSMALNKLERQLTAMSLVHIVTKTAEATIMRFHYKSALHLRYPPILSLIIEDEIKGDSLRISSIISN